MGVTKAFIRLPSAGRDDLFGINVNGAFTKAGQHSLVDLLATGGRHQSRPFLA